MTASRVVTGAALAAVILVGLGGSLGGSPAASAAVPVPADSVAVLGGATFRAWAPDLFTRIDPWSTTNLPRIGVGYYSCPCKPTVIDYPRTAGPLFGPRSPYADETIAIGASKIVTYLQSAARPSVVSGLSFGTVASDEAQRRLATDPGRPPADQLTFLLTSDPSRITPLSNAVGSYFPVGFRMPILRWTVTRPPESEYDTVVVVAEYDLAADFPDRPWNLLADINSIFGFSSVHAEVSLSNPGDVPPQNIVVTTNSLGATTTTYLVPNPVLPMLKPLESVLGPKVLSAVNKILKPMVDRGYSRNDAATGNLWPYLQPTDKWPKLVRPTASAPPAASRQYRRGGAAGTASGPAQSSPHSRTAR